MVGPHKAVARFGGLIVAAHQAHAEVLDTIPQVLSGQMRRQQP